MANPNLRQLRALAHPLRLHVLNLLETHEPATGRQLARLLDIPQARLHHHLKTLEEAGFVYISDEKPKGGVIEKYYSLKDTPWRIRKRSLFDPDPLVRKEIWEPALTDLPEQLEILRQRIIKVYESGGNPDPGEIAAWGKLRIPINRAGEVESLIERLWYELSMMEDPDSESVPLSIVLASYHDTKANP